MEFGEALKSDDTLISFFDKITSISDEQEVHFKDVIESVEQTFSRLLSDEEYEKPEFLVPDLAKYRKDVKGKRTSRVVKKKLNSTSRISSLQKGDRSSEIPKTEIADMSTDSVDSCDTIRKSSRIASKSTQVLKQDLPRISVPSVTNSKMTRNETFTVNKPAPEQPSKMNPSDTLVKNEDKQTEEEEATITATSLIRVREDISEPPSPSLPPTKIRCIENVDSKESNLNISKRSFDISTCPLEMKEPLGSSTPTNVRLEGLKSHTSYASPSNSTPKEMDSIRKLKKPQIFTAETLSAIKGNRRTRNQEKILQEKNTNVKIIEEKIQEAQKKKEVIMKSSTDEAKRKREERARKVAASREAALQEKMKQAQQLEKEKELKLKLIEKQKAEKLRAEVMKKKQLAAIKEAEVEKRRKMEEAAKLQKIKKGEQLKSEPEEYAIDHVLESASSDEEDRPKNKIPSWATKENRRRPLVVQAWLDKKELIRPLFFNKSLKYPKLETLFAGINIQARPRASSAFWNTIVDFDEAFPLHD